MFESTLCSGIEKSSESEFSASESTLRFLGAVGLIFVCVFLAAGFADILSPFIGAVIGFVVVSFFFGGDLVKVNK